VKIRVDLLSDRPHAMRNYQLQGIDGAYESNRAPGEPSRVWIKSRSPEPLAWQDIADYIDEFTPPLWKQYEAVAREAGHGGGDLLELVDFVDAIRGERPCPIDIDRAMDMTLPGLISQASIEQAGAWLDVPDSRQW
jgi:hypothetical protein